MSSLVDAARQLLDLIRKWRLESGDLDPRSSAARLAYGEVSQAVAALHKAIDEAAGTGPMFGRSRDDRDAARSILFGVCDTVVAAGFLGNVRLGESHPIRVPATVVANLEHALTLLGKTTAQAGTAARDEGGVIGRLVEVGMLDAGIIRIAHDPQLSVDDKLSRIGALDRRAVDYTSPHWRKLLRPEVSEQAIRNCRTWKEWHPKRK